MASRLRHRVRNALPLSVLSIEALRDDLTSLLDDQALIRIEPKLDALMETVRKTSRLVEFAQGDGHFEYRSIELVSWIRARSASYQSDHISTQFDLTDLEEHNVQIRANDYLLETLFINLWDNARQIVQPKVTIILQMSTSLSRLELRILDSGSGFTAGDVQWAFQYQFSRQSGDRGLGLLEIRDAVDRLQGQIALRRIPNKGYRVVLSLPTIGGF